MALQHKETDVKKSHHFQFKKSFDITKMARSPKLLMSADIMSMSCDIKLKKNMISSERIVWVRYNRVKVFVGENIVTCDKLSHFSPTRYMKT